MHLDQAVKYGGAVLGIEEVAKEAGVTISISFRPKNTVLRYASLQWSAKDFTGAYEQFRDYLKDHRDKEQGK